MVVLTNLRNVSLLVLPRFAHESCSKVAITVRGGVLKWLAVDNDTTLHGVHTDTIAFSSSVQMKCSICFCHQSLTRAPHECLKKHDPRQKKSYFIIMVAERWLTLLAW